MDAVDLQVLRCPDCEEGFTFAPVKQPQTGGHSGTYGLLQCRCFEYPVLDSVAIITKGQVGILAGHGFRAGEFDSTGPAVADVAKLVAEGHGLEALVRCLAFTPRLEFLDRLPGWRLWHTGAVPALGRRWIERRVGRMLAGDHGGLSAEDWFEYFFGNQTATDASLLPYYRNRFVLPRTLAALAVLRTLPSGEKPVLDLACGLGPFGHYLTERAGPTRVIGLDFNFYLAWGQKHLIAPKGTFVCADAHRLPFKDDTLAGVLCSDAFGHFRDKARVLDELQRCARKQPVILTRVGNRTAFPKDGDDLDAEGYLKLMPAGHTRVFSEYALLHDYLARRNPLASDATDPEELQWDKWLTFVVNGKHLGDVRIQASGEWPHETGELTFNPVFERVRAGDGQVSCRFEFPTIWFAYQNADMYSYHGHGLKCRSDIEQRARADRRGAEVRELVERFILIGLPKRYLRSQLDRSRAGSSVA
jgi:SAM-dependent methyltransferase